MRYKSSLCRSRQGSIASLPAWEACSALRASKSASRSRSAGGHGCTCETSVCVPPLHGTAYAFATFSIRLETESRIVKQYGRTKDVGFKRIKRKVGARNGVRDVPQCV